MKIVNSVTPISYLDAVIIEEYSYIETNSNVWNIADMLLRRISVWKIHIKRLSNTNLEHIPIGIFIGELVINA